MRIEKDIIPVVKVIFVGNSNVGKTQLIKRWRDDNFDKVDPTLELDFCSLKIENAYLNLWDTPGSGNQAVSVGAYITGSQIICIVISAIDSKKDKLEQIASWLKIINEKTQDKPAVVILENKMDLNNTSALTINDLEQFDGKFTLYKAVSARVGIDFYEVFQPILQPIIWTESFKQKNSHLENDDNDDRVLPVKNERNRRNPNNRAGYDLIKQKINALTENEAYIVLQSLYNLFTHGPLNKKNAPYDIKFSGGKALTFVDDTTIIVPEHVFDWVSKIKNTYPFNNQNKIILLELFDEIDQAAASKPFSRSNSTHDFYNHVLTGFITKTVNKDILNPNLNYLSLKNTINVLSEDVINNILKELIKILEKGVPANDNDNPYNVGFWGGRKHLSSITKQTIKVPEHVGALLEYLTTTKDTTKDKLFRALDSILVASCSTNSHRDRATQDFYTQLPRDLMNLINQLHLDRVPKNAVP